MNKIPDWLFGFLASSLIVFVFFWRVFLKGLIPVPADALVGLYHPYRDLTSCDYPMGIPYKNFLITDPVLQQIPWRYLVVSSWKQGELPGWNPYQFAGMPLLANTQAGSFSPWTIFFLFLPFTVAWVWGIISQSLLALWFAYLFFRELKISRWGSLFGGFVFAFGGFAIAWLTWGTILATACWLPLLLFLIHRQNFRLRLLLVGLVTALVVFSGHLQIAFYVLAVATIFTLFKKDGQSLLAVFLGLWLSAIQLLPNLELITKSWRYLNPSELLAKPDWFLPFKHLIQIVAPDFFGNPTTLNYWGEFNYGEFVAYVGIVPLILAAVSLQKDRKIVFPLLLVLLSLLLALPTPLAKLPVRLSLPFLVSLKPSRLLVLTTFGLGWLAAYGWDIFAERGVKIKEALFRTFILGTVLFFLWILTFFGAKAFFASSDNLLVAQRNLILPTLVFGMGMVLILAGRFLSKRVVLAGLFLLTLFDLFRFGWKFTPFTETKWFFPQTFVTSFLQEQGSEQRFMTLDRRLLPPNVGSVYHLASPEGYDPLLPLDYGQVMAAWMRNQPDSSFLEFNRIVRPDKFPHQLADLLGVRYILSLQDLDIEGLIKIAQEGETRVYRQDRDLPKAFLVRNLLVEAETEEAIKYFWDSNFDPYQTAIVSQPLPDLERDFKEKGKAELITYEANYLAVQIRVPVKGLLVVTDRYDSDWQVKIDGVDAKLWRVDLILRGVEVPEGEHLVEFVYRPKRFYQGLFLAGLGVLGLIFLGRQDPSPDPFWSKDE